MRVTLDVTAVPAAPAGAGRYTLELARALAALGEPELLLVSRHADRARWEDLAPRPAAIYAAAPGPRPLRLAWEQAGLPRLLRRSGADVHHGPHYTMPERSSVPVVVTIHDCTFFDHPEWHQRTKVLFFRRAIRVAAKRAAALVCVSETTAAALGAHCAVEAPVVVAPHGVDHERFSPTEPAPGADDTELRRLGVDPERPYVLFVGTVEPRKDVASLVRAFGRVARRDADVSLVIAGRRGWKDRSVDVALGSLGPARARVHMLGYVATASLPALLRRAVVVAYPSLAEGYGLPALEALACGAPLVTTHATAMAELAGEAALLVPAGDAAALADAIASVVDAGRADADVARRRSVGLARAAALTWDASARRHLDAYRLAAS